MCAPHRLLAVLTFVLSCSGEEGHTILEPGEVRIRGRVVFEDGCLEDYRSYSAMLLNERDTVPHCGGITNISITRTIDRLVRSGEYSIVTDGIEALRYRVFMFLSTKTATAIGGEGMIGEEPYGATPALGTLFPESQATLWSGGYFEGVDIVITSSAAKHCR